MEIIVSDRPGILLQIGAALEKQGIAIQNAKISTIGERAEDVFFITTESNEPLSEAECASLESELQSVLSTTR
jgi:[protein-PII] uridylyltransferase